MPLLSFDNLVCRFGEVIAWHCLIEIERAAGIRPCLSYSANPECRLAHALSLQDAAASHMHRDIIVRIDEAANRAGRKQ